jgi:hypothetical protein
VLITQNVDSIHRGLIEQTNTAYTDELVLISVVRITTDVMPSVRESVPASPARYRLTPSRSVELRISKIMTIPH